MLLRSNVRLSLKPGKRTGSRKISAAGRTAAAKQTVADPQNRYLGSGAKKVLTKQPPYVIFIFAVMLV